MTIASAIPSYRAPQLDLAGRARRTIALHVPDPAERRELGLMLGLLDVVDADDADSPTIEVCPWETSGSVAVGGPSAAPAPRARVRI